MGYILPIIVFIIGIIVFVVVIIIKIKGSKALSKIDVVENAPFIEVGSRSKFTKGYGRGLVKTQVPCKNGCTRFEFFPIDYEQGENKKRPPMQPLIVKNEMIKRMARGEDSSSYREIIRCIDRLKLDIPEKLWGSNIEKDMTIEGQKGYMKSIVGQMVRDGHKAMVEHVSEWTDIGMNKLTISTLKEKNETLRQIQSTQPSEGEKK